MIRENIYQICGHCNGDGIHTTTSPVYPYEVTSHMCEQCEGKGGNWWGWLEKEHPDEPVA